MTYKTRNYGRADLRRLVKLTKKTNAYKAKQKNNLRVRKRFSPVALTPVHTNTKVQPELWHHIYSYQNGPVNTIYKGKYHNVNQGPVDTIGEMDYLRNNAGPIDAKDEIDFHNKNPGPVDTKGEGLRLNKNIGPIDTIGELNYRGKRQTISLNNVPNQEPDLETPTPNNKLGI